MLKKPVVIIIITIIIITLISLCLIIYLPYGNIKKSIIIEAGEEVPSSRLFFIEQNEHNQDTQFVTDITTINTNIPKPHKLKIKSGRRTFKVVLQIEDTTPPKAQTINVDLYESRVVEADEFIKSIEDATHVNVSYKQEPDYSKIGKQEVYLILEDTSGNISEYQSTLRISKVKEIVDVDISKARYDVSDFLKEQQDFQNSYIVNPFFPSCLGTLSVRVSIGNQIYQSKVNIVDSIAPIAKTKDREFWTIDKISAQDFIEEIKDSTSVTLQFVEEPDYTVEGEQTVKIRLTDKGDNNTIVQAKLTLRKDTEPPIIYGVQDNTVYLNTPVAYKKGVYVVDNRDEEVPFSVDISNVNIKEEGSYKVIYSATDATGNTSKREVMLHVQEKPDNLIDREVVEGLANKILVKIITDDMSLEEKALAIYKYVNKDVYYLGGRHSDDLITEAYYALKKSPGDCYTFFAASDLLLNMAGIPNIRIERLSYEGESMHYWHMIDCGYGWYHFDASIHMPRFFSFMLTDDEANAYSIGKSSNANYYRRDTEKYPLTPKASVRGKFK